MVQHLDERGSRRARRAALRRVRKITGVVIFLVGASFSDLAGVASGESPSRTMPPKRVASSDSAERTHVSTSIPASDSEPALASSDRAPAPQVVTITFVGDIHMEGSARSLLDVNAQNARTTVADLVASSDVTIGNFESALGSGGVATAKEYMFRAPIEALDALGEMGFDVVTMANNHGLDYGRSLVDQAVASSGRSGVSIVGIGRNAQEAYAPHIVDVRGTRLAIIGVSDVFDNEYEWVATDTRSGLASANNRERLEASIAFAASVSDVTLVYVHWGTERDVCPNARQRALADDLAALGVDAVVGTHAHRVQGAGFLRNTFIAYGLGNFIWYKNSGESGQSEVVTLQLAGTAVSGFTLAPAVISGGIPSVPPEAAALELSDTYLERAACANLSAQPSEGATP